MTVNENAPGSAEPVAPCSRSPLFDVVLEYRDSGALVPAFLVEVADLGFCPHPLDPLPLDDLRHLGAFLAELVFQLAGLSLPGFLLGLEVNPDSFQRRPEFGGRVRTLRGLEPL